MNDIDICKTPSWPAALAAKEASNSASDENKVEARAKYVNLLITCASEAGLCPPPSGRKKF